MSLTVADLRALLGGLPDDALVVLSKDAEGNGHSPLAVGGEAMYDAETTWSGEIYPTADQLAAYIAEGTGHTDEDAAPDTAVRVLLLEPVN